MIIHPALSVLSVAEESDASLQPFFSYLRLIRHIKLAVKPHPPADLSPFDLVIAADTPAAAGSGDHGEQFVRAGGGWLQLMREPYRPLPHLFGAQPAPAGPFAELRVMFQNKNHPMAERLPDAVYLTSTPVFLDTTAEDAEVILYADWHYEHRPVLVKRCVGRGQVACTTLQAYDNSSFQQILYRLLLTLAGKLPANRTLGVGLLGYAPSVGKLHGLGVTATPGLVLRAACDVNQERLAEAGKDFPHARMYASADALANDPAVDLVIIATPPNTHARLCLQMMDAGKHVVCEKPLALTQKETSDMAAMAEKRRVHLSCHQNRRFDVDYLAIRQALAEGLIGELFFMETFVGGFEHPCGYWHSHAPVCGGTAYDWGGHYLDWIVSLIPDRIAAVIGTRHKRVWHDVTNADQERIQVRFAGGQEAEFMHSDIAAMRKPKWYLLGTRGAIIGTWREVTVHEIDPVLYFREHVIPATEMTPELTLHRRDCSGQIITQKLAVPPRQHYLFHRNLADHLLTGEPIAAPLEHSVLVVAILEAAARSAANGGTVEVPGA